MSFDETSLYKIKTELPGVRRSLFDLAIWKNGLAFRKINFSENGVPIIKIAELNNGIGSNTSFTKGNYDNSVRLCHDDLLFSWSGNPQTSIDIYRYQLNDGWLNQHIFKVTANEELVSKDFLFYLLKYLKSHFIQIASNKQTTGLGHVTIADLKRMSVVIPNKDIQNKVVAFIKPIDDQIQVNNEINKNLEAQARMLYRAWFIDFSNSNGEMPNSWKIGKLKDILKLNRKSTKAGELQNLPYLPIDIIPMNTFALSSFKSNEEAQSSLITFDENDIIIGAMRVYFHRVILAPCSGITRTTCFTLTPYDSEYLSFCLLCCDQDSTINYAQKTSKGSTMPYAVWDGGLGDMDIVIPDKKIIQDFNKLVMPMLEKIKSSYFENYYLNNLRDKLLPKLLLGDLDVSSIKLDI